MSDCNRCRFFLTPESLPSIVAAIPWPRKKKNGTLVFCILLQNEKREQEDDQNGSSPDISNPLPVYNGGEQKIYPLQSQVELGYLRKCIPDDAPYSSEPIEVILQDIRNDVIPGLNHWKSPNFFTYFQANASNLGFI
ncbi:Pyridoxal phosphate-dependent decarboxylase [Cinnamomum micranthum f. kanehirae]|uniref:Pyridoxal phosphate-dependent decarboxylase n=1 Tax=Cinnamomum micranthum f. kanehirae TaxID=337451 RepID=A0A3S3NEZ0_9MAGN|nr:Pyridoxal phosphate-dependent decarboxylase [Cinnamomum micranthum f. kanehirae]